MKPKTLAKRMDGVMFHANNRSEHTICYSRMANGWMLENPDVGLIEIFPTFNEAATKLEAISFSNPESWTISVNPYNGD